MQFNSKTEPIYRYVKYIMEKVESLMFTKGGLRGLTEEIIFPNLSAGILIFALSKRLMSFPEYIVECLREERTHLLLV